MISIAKADILCEFLEAAFHLILYVRGVYPPGRTNHCGSMNLMLVSVSVLFQRRRKYHVPVQV